MLRATLYVCLTFTSVWAAQEEPRFDVNVNEAPARAFFSGLVDGTPYNILVHPDVGGRISLQLKHVTVEEVLDAVRDLYGYDYRRVSTGYLVLPASLQTRLFRLNYLDVERRGISKTRVSSGKISNGNGAAAAAGMESEAESASADTGTADVSGTSVVTSNSSNFWEAIATDLRAIIGASDKAGERSVVINSQSGVIVVRAMPNELRDVADYLAKTERTVTQQVILEAKIVEVELSDAYQAGINWAAVLRDGNKQYFLGQRTPPGGFDGDLLAPPDTQVPVGPGNPIDSFITNALGGAFTLAADFADFNAFIELLGLQGRTKVLSSPRVSTLHNQKAVIKAGSDEYFVTGVSSDTVTGEATTTTVDLELTPFFSGVALDVTPQISEAGEVLMHIHPTVSDVTDQQKVFDVRGETDSLPLALSQIRESDSIVRARSGQVIVIGGLMRQTRRQQDYKMPLLGDVPVLGRLFRSERDQTSTVELVILLRPLVVADQDWPQLVKEPMDRIDEMTRRGKLQ
ncbi:MAG: pilus (MSHA type) biogenesis protein MshL [Steroidobacteraceae bacterium]